MNKFWHVIYVASRQEKKVFERLIQRQIHGYLPLINVLKQWSDRKKKVEEPLFRGYVFVHIDAAQRDMVLQIPGVVKFIRYNGKDAVIPPKEIEILQQLIEVGYHVSAYTPSETYSKGTYVQIMEGPLKGRQAVISDVSGQKYVLMVFTDTELSVTIKMDQHWVHREERA